MKPSKGGLGADRFQLSKGTDPHPFNSYKINKISLNALFKAQPELAN